MCLASYQAIETRCSEDAAVLKSYIEKDWVYNFLVSLNAEFDWILIQILGKEDVSSLNGVKTLVRPEESHRAMVLEPQATEDQLWFPLADNFFSRTSHQILTLRRVNHQREQAVERICHLCTIRSWDIRRIGVGSCMESHQARSRGTNPW